MSSTSPTTVISIIAAGTMNRSTTGFMMTWEVGTTCITLLACQVPGYRCRRSSASRSSLPCAALAVTPGLSRALMKTLWSSRVSSSSSSPGWS